MSQLPDRLPTLSSGKQDPGSGKVCAEQAVNWLVSGRLDLDDETDTPQCVQPVLNALAITVNDRLPDSRRGEMWPIILRQPGTAHPGMEPVLSVRLAAWCATQVLDLTGTKQRDAKKAIAAALAWCDNPCEETAANADAANAVAYAADVANAAAYAANAAADAAYAATHAAYAAANATLAAYAAAYAANAVEAAANGGANAANAAAYAANAANAANAADSAARLLALLEGAQAECERLTGHTPAAPDLGRIERLCLVVVS